MRKPRLKIQGGLYHIIARGNNRHLIVGSNDDYHKFRNSPTKKRSSLSTFMPTA